MQHSSAIENQSNQFHRFVTGVLNCMAGTGGSECYITRCNGDDGAVVIEFTRPTIDVIGQLVYT